MHLGNQWREPMKSAEETTTLKKRVTWVEEHWRLFFSEMPLREKNLQSVTQTLETKVETSTKTNGTQTPTIKHKSD
jgi:hypothetical protein